MKYGIIVNGRVTEPVTIPAERESDALAWLAVQFPGYSGWVLVSEDAVPGAAYNGPGSSTNPTSVPVAARAPLTLLAFLRLCQKAGGMTDEMLVACEGNAAFKAFWIKFRVAQEIVYGDEDTEAGLQALAFANYLPNGQAAVKSAWPNK